MTDSKKEQPPEKELDLNTGRLGRAFQLSKMAAGAGSKWLFGKVKNAVSEKDHSNDVFASMAEQMLPTMAKMRGMSMKIGQMLSYLDDFFPPEARKVLAVLQKDAIPMPWHEVEQQFIQTTGKTPFEMFAEFDPKPVAAASIGQVHKARLPDGTQVAVKIQYPGIEEAMKADMKNTQFLGPFKHLMFMNVDMKNVFQEIEERFLEECDYRYEAHYQQLFHKRFEGHPWIRIPKVYPEYSNQRVLTSEWIEGITFHEWLETDPSFENRDHITRAFYRFYIGSFYKDGLFHCDPHPGNYIFLENGQIAFLDYGCVRIFPEERRNLWIQMCKVVGKDEVEKMHELSIQLGFFKEKSKYDAVAYRELMRYLYQPYLKDEEFDFQKQRPKQTFREMFVDNPNFFKLNMPADSVFLNRIGFGLVTLLSEIGTTLNCRAQSNHYFEGNDPDWPEDPFLGIPFHQEVKESLQLLKKNIEKT